jgi:hypothetical protein
MPLDIRGHPQVAVLAVLDSTLVTAARAIAAAHPELYGVNLPAMMRKSTHRADQVVYLACELQRALSGYRAALNEERSPGGPLA